MTDEQGLRLFREARAIVPGLLSATGEQGRQDAKVLYQTFFNTAMKEPDVSMCDLWGLLFKAAMWWLHDRVGVQCQLQGKEAEDVLREMALFAATMQAGV
jgi:hypothetical protein